MPKKLPVPGRLPTAEELTFVPFPYSEIFPPIGCCMCGKNVPATGGLKAEVPLPDAEQPMVLAVCSAACMVEVAGARAGAVTSFIMKEAGRLKRLFPKKDS